MSRAKFLWCLKLLGCVLLVFVVLNTVGPVRNLLWWMLHNAGRTMDSKALFNTKTYLPYCAALGGLLGLMPLARLSGFLSNLWGRIYRGSANHVDESDLSRPLLWAWAPFALVWLPRFLMYRNPNDSVFGASTGLDRWSYFFGNAAVPYLQVDMFTASWMFVRTMLTGPMLFAASYSLTVWVRIKLAPEVLHLSVSEQMGTDVQNKPD